MLAERKALSEPHQRSCIYIPIRQRLWVRSIAARENVSESEIHERLIEAEMRRLDQECEGK